VKGAAECPGILVEGVTVAGRELTTHVEYIDASPGVSSSENSTGVAGM